METIVTDSLRTKIKNGPALSFSRLGEKTIKEGGELGYSKNGKIIRVQAKDLK